MKPRYVVWIAGLATVAYGFGLVHASRDDLDIWIGLGGWLLGFWFASAILNLGNPSPDEVDEEELEDDWEDQDEE